MKLRVWIAGIGLAMVLGGSALLPPKGTAQDAATDASKRKVRTKVAPEYPALARQMNVTGKVKIETTIAADGHVMETKVIGGSPLLVNAALDAVKKWRFEPASKDTTEVIEFEFSGQE
ncbi:MAG: energy transducer TonB [Candidatus Acidiferrales bacterium]